MPLTADRESYYRHSAPGTTREVIVWVRGGLTEIVAHDRNEAAGVKVTLISALPDAAELGRQANAKALPLAILADWIEDHAGDWPYHRAEDVAFVARWLREVDLAAQI